MLNKLSRYADGVMEAAWLAVVVLLPVFFNLYSSRIFEPDKIALLRSLALIILSAWLVKGIADRGLARTAEAQRQGPTWREILRIPLVLPALSLLVVTLVSTLFSITPGVSFWGSYQRLQGAYTTMVYLVLFAALLAHLRSAEKFQRLITAIIISSLPVALYGILQRYQLDPIPWGGDVTIRVAANLGNSIFVAAYLIMVIPLTAGRMLLAFRTILKNESPQAPAMLRATLYVFIGVMQVYTLYLSGSRGPALGWMAGSFLMALVLANYTRKRWLVGGFACFTVLAIVFLALFNTQGGVFESLRNQPAIGRFGKLLDPESNTALVRKHIWRGAARLVAPHAPLTYPEGSLDTWNSLRLLVGYGPEAMIVAYNPFYPPELAHVERRNATPDRSHNEVWDTLVTGGFLGLGVYLATILTIFFWGFRWLGLIPSERWKKAFWLILGLSGLASGLGLAFLLEIAYVGVGLAIGLLLGVVLYVMLVGLSGRVQAPDSEAEFIRAITILGLLSAVLAHFVETNFGIAIGVTRAYFWVYAALLVMAGLDLIRLPAPQADTEAVTQLPDALASRRKKAASQGVKSGSTPEPGWLRSALMGGLILALLFGALGYNLLSNPGGEDARSADVWASLTQLKDLGPGASWAVVGLILITLSAGALLLGAESGLGESYWDWWKTVLASLAVAALPGMVYWVWHASTLIAISQVRASTIAEVMGQVARFESLPANFLAFTLGLVFLSPLPGLLGGPAAQNTSPAKLALGALTFALAISLGVITNLRPIQADVAFKLAGQFNQSDSWQVAVEIYQEAIKLAPREDYYYLFLGQAYLETANTVEAGAQQESQLLKARDSLLAAQKLNPLNPDHTANLARLYNLWALMAEDPALRAERANQADRYFAAAVRLSPTHARLWDEWSLLQRDVFQNELRSRELLDQALAIDPQYDWTYVLVGDLYLRQVSTENTPLSAEQTREILEKAATAYQTALQYVDEDSTQSIATYKLALANVFRRLERYDEALSLLSDPILQDVLDPWRIAEQLGRIHQLKGELDEAQFYAQQALALAPEEQRAVLQAWLDQLGRTP